MNAHVRHPLIPAEVSPIGPAETMALEYLQRQVRERRSPSASDVSRVVGCYDDSPVGAEIIESLIEKGYLARQYTVLLPLPLEHAE